MIISATKPGGWVEFQDWDTQVRSEDGTLKGTNLEKFIAECINAFEKAGYETRPGPNLEQWFREAGFVDVHVKKYYVPQGMWAKDPYYVCEDSFLSPSYIYYLLLSITNFIAERDWHVESPTGRVRL